MFILHNACLPMQMTYARPYKKKRNNCCIENFTQLLESYSQSSEYSILKWKNRHRYKNEQSLFDCSEKKSIKECHIWAHDKIENLLYLRTFVSVTISSCNSNNKRLLTVWNALFSVLNVVHSRLAVVWVPDHQSA